MFELILPSNFSLTVEPEGWLIWLWHIHGAFSIILNLLSAYCIIKKSSDDMKTYKWFLFNIWIWSFTTDFNISFIMQPHSYFPIVGGASANRYYHMLPVYVQFGHVVYMIFSICMCTSSLAAGFLYRWFAVLPNCWVTQKPSRLFWTTAAIHIQMAIPCVFMLIINAPDRKDMKNYLIKNVRNYQEILDSGYSYIVFHPSFCPTFQYCLLTWILYCLQAFFVGVFAVVDSDRRLNSYTNLMSLKTKTMHSKMMFALVVQGVVPLASYLIPVVIAMCIVAFSIPIENLQARLNIMVAIFSTHSTWNCLLMLVLYRCYRRFLWNIVLRMTPRRLRSLGGSTLTGAEYTVKNVTVQKHVRPIVAVNVIRVRAPGAPYCSLANKNGKTPSEKNR